MVDIKLNGDAIRYITLFEGTTGAAVKDFLENGNTLIYIVEDGQLRRALGRNSENIRFLKKKIKKEIDVIEYTKKPKRLLKNIFHNFKIDEIKLETRDEKRVAIVSVDPTLKAKAIGRAGRNLKIAKEIIRRHHVDVDDILIA